MKRSATIKSTSRYAPRGSFREAMRLENPELAATLDEAARKSRAALDAEMASGFELESPEDDAPARRTHSSDPVRREMTEAEVVAEILAAWREKGWEREVTFNAPVTGSKVNGGHYTRQTGRKGRPDLYCYPGNGIVAFVEAKKPHGGVISYAQEQWMERMTRLGYSGGFATSAEEAVAIVEKAIDAHRISACRVAGPLSAPTSAQHAATLTDDGRTELRRVYDRHLQRARAFSAGGVVTCSWPATGDGGSGFVFEMVLGAGKCWVATWEGK